MGDAAPRRARVDRPLVMARSLVNFTVHGIGEPARELEPDEHEVWVSLEQFEQVLDALMGRDDARITFDDSNASDVEIALPRLLERGLTAEFFVLAGRLGEPGRLTAGDVRDLAKAGMLVGSHGWAHRDWRLIDDEHALEEIDGARTLLKGLTGRHVGRVSIPFGSYDRHVLARLRRAGVSRVYTSDGGRARADAWLQPRNSLRHDLAPEWTARLLDRRPLAPGHGVRMAARVVKRSRGQWHGRTAAPDVWLSAPVAAVDEASAGLPPRLPRIGAVIVTYNSARVLGGCLEALCNGADGVDLTDVVVVDNASRDDSLAVADDFPLRHIRTIEMGRNAGYAAGINAGVDALDIASLDAVLVINPDCRLHAGALATLAKAMTASGCGITVPLLLESDGRLQPSLRRAPTVRRALAEAVLGHVAGHIGELGELVFDPRAYEQSGEWAWATGAAMLLSTEMIADLGPWDESFLLYSEETEYALRAADHGWALHFTPAAVIEHAGADSGSSPALAALLTTNRVELFRRRRGAAAGGAFFAAVLLGELLRAGAGRPNSRAAVIALLRPSRRTYELQA